MLKRKLLNFTFQQIIRTYGHIDGFTKEAAPRLNFFLLGVYYNLNIFQIYYSVSFLKTFFFIYNNITIKGLPVLVISSLNIFNKKITERFLQYYSFGNWTHGLFSNWLYCKSFLNVSKYPFLNRKIKTIPKIIVGLNNNFFLEREVKNTYTSIITFAFINSNYFDIKRYFAPYNTDSFISINFYLKIFHSLHDRSSLMKLKFFWSFEYIEKIINNRSIKRFSKTFFKKRFFAKRRSKHLTKKKKYAYTQNFNKLIYNKKRRNRRRIVLLSDYDPVNKILQDKIRITKIIVRNRIKLKKSNLSNKFKKYLGVHKKKFNSNNSGFNKFSKKTRKHFFKNFVKGHKSFNFIFLYFQLVLKLMTDEKRLVLLMTNILNDDYFVLNKIFQFKIKKLIILKLFLRYSRQLSARNEFTS